MEEFNLEEIKAKALEQIRTGQPLLGKDGAFAPLLESVLNTALEGEMDAHLTQKSRTDVNRHNCKSKKQVQTDHGEFSIETPRNHDSSFDPQIIKKRERMLADGATNRIIVHIKSVIGCMSI